MLWEWMYPCPMGLSNQALEVTAVPLSPAPWTQALSLQGRTSQRKSRRSRSSSPPPSASRPVPAGAVPTAVSGAIPPPCTARAAMGMTPSPASASVSPFPSARWFLASPGGLGCWRDRPAWTRTRFSQGGKPAALYRGSIRCPKSQGELSLHQPGCVTVGKSYNLSVQVTSTEK